MEYNEDNINQLLQLPYPKVLFTTSHRESENTVFCTSKTWNSHAKKDIHAPVITGYKNGYKRCFEYVFDPVEWINRSLASLGCTPD